MVMMMTTHKAQSSVDSHIASHLLLVAPKERKFPNQTHSSTPTTSTVPSSEVSIGNVPITNKNGNVRILENVLHVPEMKNGLMSLTQLPCCHVNR
jgi:hypothetical protein